jgi:cytochrome c
MRFPRTSLFGIAIAGLLLAAAAAAGAYAYAQRSDAQRKAAMLTGGDPRRAPDLLRQYGCTGCHQVPGVRAPGGLVGPPLRGLKERVYVGGVLVNTPENLVRWIVDPKAFNPRTAMPVTGLGAQDARHIAAYLYAAQ